MNSTHGTATENIAVKIDDTTGPDGNAAPPKKPLPVAWPKRQRPTDNYNAALGFIGSAITHMSRQGTPLTTKNLGEVEKMYGNYCWNVGLRGKQKKSVWNIIKAQILEIKREADKLKKVEEL